MALSSQVSCGLAPMEGVSDLAFRLWMGLTSSPRFMWTPFLRVTDTFPGGALPRLYAPEHTELKGCVSYELYPQVMGSRSDDVVRAGEVILRHSSFVDLNCGCPSSKVVGNKSGSSLLENADDFRTFIERVVSQLGPQRLSVKMRTGFHSNAEFPFLIGAIANSKLRHLTVHGRTRPERYTGEADWALIGGASRKLSFPVIGSGDVIDSATCQSRLAVASNVKSVIIGRGALRNPWVFSKCTSVPLIEPLECYALIQHLSMTSPDDLLAWAKEGHALVAAEDDIEAWRRTLISLQVFAGYDLEALSFRVLPRLKMLWSYLRSSLPDCFMKPELLRSRSMSDFLGGLKDIASRHEISLEAVALCSRPELNWMYSGQGKQ